MNCTTNKKGRTSSALKDEVNIGIFTKATTTIHRLYCMYHNPHLSILLNTTIKYINMAEVGTSELLIADIELD